MNRNEAKKAAVTNTRSIGDLRALIEKTMAADTGRMSRVNPMFTLEQACGIYMRALADRDAAEVPEGEKPDPYSMTGRMRRTGDSLTIQNILRDCG